MTAIRYKLRTLLIAGGVVPPLLAGLWYLSRGQYADVAFALVAWAVVLAVLAFSAFIAGVIVWAVLWGLWAAFDMVLRQLNRKP
jgi:hypothetical protein